MIRNQVKSRTAAHGSPFCRITDFFCDFSPFFPGWRHDSHRLPGDVDRSCCPHKEYNLLPEYRRQGLAREMMFEYLRREQEKGREIVFLTCLAGKVKMYKKLGFLDRGIGDSTWGGEQWHEMSCFIS